MRSNKIAGLIMFLLVFISIAYTNCGRIDLLNGDQAQSPPESSANPPENINENQASKECQNCLVRSVPHCSLQDPSTYGYATGATCLIVQDRLPAPGFVSTAMSTTWFYKNKVTSFRLPRPPLIPSAPGNLWPDAAFLSNPTSHTGYFQVSFTARPSDQFTNPNLYPWGGDSSYIGYNGEVCEWVFGPDRAFVPQDCDPRKIFAEDPDGEYMYLNVRMINLSGLANYNEETIWFDCPNGLENNQMMRASMRGPEDEIYVPREGEEVCISGLVF